MQRLCHLLLILTWLSAFLLPVAMPVVAAPLRGKLAGAISQVAVTPTGRPQGSTPAVGASAQPPSGTPKPPDLKPILDRMTVADKVGQLFVVTFEGNDTSLESDIATLVRDYRVGGVLLSPGNGNFRSVPAPGAPITSTQGAAPTQAVTISTPRQIVQLSNALQNLGMSTPRPITGTAAITSTVQPTATLRPPTATPAGTLRIPLLVGLEWPGDDSSFFAGSGGLTPLPSSMAIGATWSPSLAEKVGQVVGQELQAMGINLLAGPTLDVLDVPRPGSRGDLDVRTFGGDPFWVGQMGQAFIRGIQAGGQGKVVTAAKHFPGQGASDRRPDDEVATVQKTVQQLRQIELAPFAAVTAGSPNSPGTTAALMTSHIRYRGFQGNIRQLTPPISLAPQLQDLMALKEFADWRAAGGVLISDALGVPALRRYYDPQLQKFPHRQVAQDAFLAGNDLLLLSRFALTDNWPDQFAAIKETILFFQSKYRDDEAFRGQVDAAVTRILALKLQLYGGSWQASPLRSDAASIDQRVGQSTSVTLSVARAGLTLIYPGRDELADRMPSAPLADESILIFTDARSVRECAACAPLPLITPNALQEIMLRLYGPTATGQVSPSRIRSLTFADLNRLLNSAPGAEYDLEQAIANARWIVFAQLDYNPEEYPESAALRTFLAKRSDSLRDKRLVAMAFGAPYYLDTTEISKLTAYFGVYGRTAPFLETAVRALFREFSPVGASPVSISGINYDLIKQLESAPSQVISLSPVGSAADLAALKASIQVGSRIPLETGVIVDRKGHPVPDGTLVEFHLRYPGEALQLAPQIETTVAGLARTTVVLDRPGELWITAQSGEAKDSARIVLKIGGDAPGSIATVLPSPTSSVTPTTTPLPTHTPTPDPSPTPTATSTPVPTSPPLKPRVALPAFFYGLLGVVLASGAAFAVRRRSMTPALADSGKMLSHGLEAALWAILVAWTAYLLYSVGWLPGSTQLQAGGRTWAAGAVTLVGGLLTLLWSGRRSTN